MKNFWEENGDLLVVEEFRRLYEGDGSEGKEWSSRVMWAVYYIWDYGSRYFVLPLEERRLLVERDFLGEEGFFASRWGELGGVVERYRYLQKDSEYRFLETWAEAVESRRRFMDRLKAKAEEMSVRHPEKAVKLWEYLDKMLLNSKAILSQKDELMERVRRSGEGKVKGGMRLSLLARGLLDRGGIGMER